MLYFFKLAAKNLFRHKLRTLVSILAIAISIMVVVFTRGLIVGFIDSVFSAQIHYQSGHIRIIDRDYKLKEKLLSLNYTVNGWQKGGVEEMVADLEKLEEVEMALPRIKFGAAATSADEELVRMAGWGIIPDRERDFTDVKKQLVEGRLPRPGEAEVTMGAGLLSRLGLEVDEKVTIVYNTSYSSFKGATFRVVGKLESELPMINDNVFYLPLDEAQRILYLEDRATEILLVTPNFNKSKEYLPAVEELLREKGVEEQYTAISWDDAGGMVEYMKLAQYIYNFIYVFLVVLAGFVVINTMVMIVKERTREIGMMSAMGMESSGIMKLFIIEGSIMSVIGSFIGAVMGGIITRILSITGINYGSELEAMGEDFLMSTVLYPEHSPENMIFGFVLGVVVITIACIIPARRAADLEPTDALKEI